jgi:hypothetical protein
MGQSALETPLPGLRTLVGWWKVIVWFVCTLVIGKDGGGETTHVVVERDVKDDEEGKEREGDNDYGIGGRGQRRARREIDSQRQ